MSVPTFRVFLSAVSSEFEKARSAIASDLRSRGIEVKFQDDFRQESESDTTLRLLHNYIRDCSAVIALIGERSGSFPPPAAAQPFTRMLPDCIKSASYTQWEVFLGRHFRKRLSIYHANADYTPDRPEPIGPDSPELQEQFVTFLFDKQGLNRSSFSNIDQVGRLVLREDWPQYSSRHADLKIGQVVYGDLEIRPITLRAPLRKVFEPLLESSMGLFAGRGAALNWLAESIISNDKAYLVVTSPAAFGKTSLIAKLVSETPEAFAYHFFTSDYGPSSLSESFFLRNIVEQMAQWHQLEQELPQDLNALRALYQRFIDESVETSRVVVLDGLDEVYGWRLAPYLNRRLPGRLKLILTIRDVGQDWITEYELPRDQTAHLALDGLLRHEVAEVLTTAGGPAAAVAGDAMLLDQVVRVSTSPEYRMGADPFYVRVLAEDLRSGEVSPEQVGVQPAGLTRYLDRWLSELESIASRELSEAEKKAVFDVLGTLVVALGRISRADIEAINKLPKSGMFRVFPKALNVIRRFVIGDDESGYVLMHSRLRQYMQNHIDVDTIEYLERLVLYCGKWYETRSAYALTYYLQHLVSAGQGDALLSLMRDHRWYECKLTMDPSGVSYLSDVDFAWTQADKEDYADLEKGKMQNLLSRQISYALMTTSARCASRAIPPALLVPLVRTENWLPREAMEVIRQYAEPSQKKEGLLLLTPLLRGNALLEAVDVARNIRTDRVRVETLAGMAPFLPDLSKQGVLNEAADAAREAKDPSHIASGLLCVARHLPEKEQAAIASEALAATEAMDLSPERAHLGAQTLGYMQSTALHETEWESLAGSVAYLARVGLPIIANADFQFLAAMTVLGNNLQTLRDVLTLASPPRWSNGTSGETKPLKPRDAVTEIWWPGEVVSNEAADELLAHLNVVAPHYGLVNVIASTIGAVVSVTQNRIKGTEKYLAFAFVCIHPYLPGHVSQLLRAVVMQGIRCAEDPSARAQGLAAVASTLSEADRKSVVEEAIDAMFKSIDSWSISFTWGEGWEAALPRVLECMAPDQKQRELERILHVIRLKDRSFGAAGYPAIIPFLTPPLRTEVVDEALVAAKLVDHKSVEFQIQRMEHLLELLPLLTHEQQEKVCTELRASVDLLEVGEMRAYLYSAIVKYHTGKDLDDLLSEALNSVRRIGDKKHQARALANIGVRLDRVERDALLSHAGDLIEGLVHAEERSGILLRIVNDFLEGGHRADALEIANKLLSEEPACSRWDRALFVKTMVLLSEGQNGPERDKLIGWAVEVMDKNPPSMFDTEDELLAPHLTRNQLEAWAAATALLVDPDSRGWRRAILCHYLPRERCEEVAGQALLDAAAIDFYIYRGKILTKIADVLPLRSIKEAISLTHAMSERNDDWAMALAALVPRISLSERETVISSALAEAKNAGVYFGHSPGARVILSDLRQGEARWEILHEALLDVPGISWSLSKISVFNLIVSRMPDRFVDEALRVALEAEDDETRVAMLSVLAGRLRPPGKEFVMKDALDSVNKALSALHAASEQPNELRLSEAFTRLVPELPKEDLHQAMELALDFSGSDAKADALKAIASRLPEIDGVDLTTMCHTILRRLSTDNREDFLRELSLLASTLEFIGGKSCLAASGYAIIESGNRWP